MSDQIQFIGSVVDRFTITFTPEAHAQRELALYSSALVARVTNAEENAVAVSAQANLTQIIRAAEAARVAAKEPILEAGRAIDKAAKEFVEELKAEQLRVATLVGEFQELELSKQRAAENARRIEAERLEAERLAEIRRVQEVARAAQAKASAEAAAARKRIEDEERAARAAEQVGRDLLMREAARMDAERQAEIKAEQRKAEEAARAAAAERQREIDRIKAEEDRQLALSQAKSAEEQDKINDAHCRAVESLPSAPEPVRAEGQTVRTDWEITVSDVWLLARVHPMCVEIKPRLREIRELLDHGLKVAGISAKRVAKSGITTKATTTIAV